METGKYPDWRSEQDPSASGESKPESDKKKKRRRGEADSARARRIAAALEAETKAPKKGEHQRARKALADILVEQSPAEVRAKRKESGEAARSAEAEKKPATEGSERAAAALENAGAAVHESTNDDSERDKAARAERAERDHGIPQPERDRLRPGELWGGEFVIDLQDNKTLDEREIPLHDIPVSHETPARTERTADPVPEHVLSVSHEPEALEEVSSEEADHEAAPEPVPDHEPVPEQVTPPVFHRQVEQPGPARAFEVSPPEEFIPTASARGPEAPAGGLPETDPAAVAPEGFEAVAAANAAQHYDPADVYPMYANQPAARVVNSGPNEQMVTKQEADDAVYYAARGAQARGVAAGFLFAALWARHRGKKLRRHFNGLLGKQEKELKKNKEEQHFYAAEQASKQAETDRRLSAAEQRYAYAERQLAARPQAEAQYAAGPLAEMNPTRSGNGRREAVPMTPEAVAQMQKNQRARLPEQAPQDAPEQLNVPPEHRLEASAWHTIEVDARTGRPVEQPTFAYGHEYYQERKHESAPADHRNAAAGEVALVGAAVAGSQNGSGGAGGGPTGAGGSPALPPNIPSASMQGPPPGSPTAKVRDARTNITKATASGPIWPLVVALLIIFVVLIFLLG